MTDYSPKDRAIFGQELISGLVDNTLKYIDRAASLNPELKINTDQKREIMRELGRRVSDASLLKISPQIFGESKLDPEDLEFILEKKELPKSFFDQFVFLSADAIAKVLHHIIVDKNTAENVREVFSEVFGGYEDIDLSLKMYSKYRVEEETESLIEIDEDGGEDLVEKDAMTIDFPMTLNMRADQAFEKLYGFYQSGSRDFTGLKPDLVSVRDLFGEVKDAPKPRDELVMVSIGGPLGVPMNPLIAFYKSKRSNLSTKISDGNVASVYSVYQRTFQKLVDAEIGFEDAAKFLLFLQKFANSVKEDIPEQYAKWYEEYKSSNGLGA